MSRKVETDQDQGIETVPNQMNNIISIDQRPTDEEFENFLQRVNQVEKAIKKMSSHDKEEQKCGEILAEEILQNNKEKEIGEITELKIKSERTIINKYPSNTPASNVTDQEVFKRSVEKDAKERAENRKIRNERAETLKVIANKAFKDENYEKAITYYDKALEQRKDSALLWNNRALSYMRLGLFEKALSDFEWALKVNNSNIKALLNSAKCWKYLGNEKKSNDFLTEAKEKNPHFKKFIEGCNTSKNHFYFHTHPYVYIYIHVYINSQKLIILYISDFENKLESCTHLDHVLMED
ncbi:tetratricopeptide repeat protein 12-like [Prorops nasuta]|uniref:tetratricopeptide repeat protein 12-like n=1 Tax=Prorops nasuta TaxID=863751 RepID=UPI0034CF1C1B